MTEFKQIVGRGTRVHEDTRKFYFTLIDFRGATNHFADPEFDGDPVQIYEPGEDDPVAPPDGFAEGEQDGFAVPEGETVIDGLGTDDATTAGGGDGGQHKVFVDGVGAKIVAERVEYLDAGGKLVTESLRDYTKAALLRRFASLDDFLRRWNSAERKQAVLDELAAEGLPLDVVAGELGLDLDPFDLVCHVAFDRPPLTRRERAEAVVKRDAFARYGDKARAVLDALLAKYRDEGVLNLDDMAMLKVAPFSSMGSVVQLVSAFGGRAGFQEAAHALQEALYRETA